MAGELRALGHSVTLCVAAGKAAYLAFAKHICAHDVVIFQKTYSRYDLWLAALARRLGKRVLFDIDDAPSRSGSESTMARAAMMMRGADAVMLGSSALAELARESGARAVHLVPSGVRLANYRQIAPRGGAHPVCLGWLGNGAHYADDLIDVLRDPLAALAQRLPLRLRIVGACGVQRLHDTFGGIAGLPAEFLDQVDWSTPAAVAAAIAPFDIGLYPLKPGPFNDFKCGFKALEYMASGLPVVASSIAVNAEVVEAGVTGYLVENAEGWTRALETLATDPDLRAKMGAAGRARVEAEFTTERIAMQVARIAEEKGNTRCNASPRKT
jgi:glycosyltransferase involved in cell wall biosynthesis